MTIFTYFLKWRHNEASYGQHLDHLGKKIKCSNEKVNEGEHKHREVWKKKDQLKKKPCTHIHIICKQKK